MDTDTSDRALAHYMYKKRMSLAKEEFQNEFGVKEKPCAYVCPACTMGFTVGKLYESLTEPGLFTCNKCRLTFGIECQDMTNEEFFIGVAEEKRKKREEKKTAKQSPTGSA